MGPVLPRLILQLVDDSLIIVARGAQFPDVFLGDVLLALPGSFRQAKARGLGVLQLSFAPFLLPPKVFDKVHYELVYPVRRVVDLRYT